MKGYELPALVIAALVAVGTYAFLNPPNISGAHPHTSASRITIDRTGVWEAVNWSTIPGLTLPPCTAEGIRGFKKPNVRIVMHSDNFCTVEVKRDVKILGWNDSGGLAGVNHTRTTVDGTNVWHELGAVGFSAGNDLCYPGGKKPPHYTGPLVRLPDGNYCTPNTLKPIHP